MFRFTFARFAPAIAAAALLGLLIVPGSVLAHERRTIGNGKYDVVVGWDVEPAYEGIKNGASIRITQAGSDPAVPVEGADKTLKVQIRQGATTREFPLRAVFGQKGYYVADMVPTRAADYQWMFVGSLDGDQVNDTFDTADGKFNKVEPIAGLQFPQALPNAEQQAAAIQTARSDAESARTLAFVGIGVGVLGLLAAFGVWFTRPRLSVPLQTNRPATEPV